MDKHMFILAAAVASKEDLIEKLEEAISRYKEAALLQNEEDMKDAFNYLTFVSHMVLINHESGGKIKGAFNLVKRMDEIEKREKLFDTSDIKN